MFKKFFNLIRMITLQQIQLCANWWFQLGLGWCKLIQICLFICSNVVCSTIVLNSWTKSLCKWHFPLPGSENTHQSVMYHCSADPPPSALPCLTGLDLTKHVKLLFIQHKQSREMEYIECSSFIEIYGL